MRYVNMFPGSLVALLLACSNFIVMAADDQYLLSSEVYEEIMAARELMDKKEYSQAESRLNALLGKDITAYEKAVANQTLGYVYISTDKYSQATTAFIKSVEANALPPEVTHDINFNIAQLLSNDGKHKESLEYLNAWFAKESSPDPQAHMLAATIYYRLGDYKNMIPQVSKAIEKSDKPEQGWYEMLLAGYFETSDHKNAAVLLEKMIRLYPETDNYWLQLAAMYQFLKQYKKSIAIYELALKKNLLGEQEIIQLVQLYLNEDVPYKAGQLLDEMINNGKAGRNTDNLELLANSWLLAKEYDRATEVLTTIAQLKNDPAIYFRIGQIYFEQEKWPDSITALEQAVKDQNLNNLAEAWLLLGIAAYHNNDIKLSTRALNRASGFKTTHEQARWWLNKLGSEMDDSGSS